LVAVSTPGGTIEILEISSSRNNNSSVQSCRAEKMRPLSAPVFIKIVWAVRRTAGQNTIGAHSGRRDHHEDHRINCCRRVCGPVGWQYIGLRRVLIDAQMGRPFSGQSGQHLLALSLSGLDPNRSLGHIHYRSCFLTISQSDFLSFDPTILASGRYTRYAPTRDLKLSWLPRKDLPDPSIISPEIVPKTAVQATLTSAAKSSPRNSLQGPGGPDQDL
jgi:hypothetical protein